MKARVINGFNRNDQPPTIKQTGDRQWAGALLLLIYVALVPSLAHAGPIESGVDWLLDLLTNGIARSVAIIALAILG